jgi:two-component system, response regulator PdtaR
MIAELSGVCVLVVEDEPIIALDLASMLEDAGAKVIGPALTLDEADRLSENGLIAVAVLDVRIRRGTIARVASKLSLRGVPIVFHTGHASAETLLARWPDSRVLVKPARPEDLLAALLAVLHLRQP